jgi:signal transduction histidine kinase
VAQERSQVIAEADRRVLRHRKQVPHTLAEIALWLGAALLPSIKAPALMGAATISVTLAWAAPGIACIALTFFLYGQLGSDNRWVRRGVFVELFFSYVFMLAFAYSTRQPTSALWAVVPHTTILWANNAPTMSRGGVLAIALASIAAVALCLLSHQSALGITAAITGALSCLVFWIASRRVLRTVLAEAERNVARERMHELEVDQVRAHVASALQAHVGDKLAALTREIHDLEAHALLEELDNIVRPLVASRSLGALAREIGEKCRPLCANFEQPSPKRADFVIDGNTCVALLRISQEFVRNAITHGRASKVSVELDHDGCAIVLRVRDDGTGLSPEAFAQATGGLANAKVRLTELSGNLRLLDDTGVTELLVTI